MKFLSMQKYGAYPRFFICIFTFLATGIFLPQEITASDIVVLKPGAKIKAASRQQPRKTAAKLMPQEVISLGDYRSIGRVKKKVDTPAKSSRSLPKIRKQISSKSVMIMDATSGETIFALNPDTPRQPASTIKVLTGIIALQSMATHETIEVSSKAANMPRSKIYLDTRKKYLANDLINAVLLASANDASVALAEKIAGNEKKFAYMMTLRAKLWGAKQTICKTASGLTAKGQKSTARDLANIFRHAMKNKEFAKRMKQRKIVTSYGKTLYNHNKALWRVNGTQGGKTGYTLAARQTYVGQFSRNNETIVIAILGSETMWGDLKRLVEYGFKKKENLRLASGGDNISREMSL